MHNISIFGTSSDAGKSTLTFIVAKLLQNRGIKTTVFKAQNVSNNSHIADDGAEIAISTHFQSRILGVETSWHQNPILLKSGKMGKVSLIVRGRELDQKDIHSYFRDLKFLKPVVNEGFLYLNGQYDCVVAEGAGGCVELNLLDKDLSNTYIADQFNTKIILVADIEKGGVFASVYGTIQLLKEKFRENLIGVVINKFRGDRSLFDDGVKIIEKDFGIKVLGVLPYKSINLGFEDSGSLQNYTQTKDAKIKVGVISFPHMSNFNDFEPLILDDEVEINFITSNIFAYDMLILPGTKMVADDLLWMKDSGLFDDLCKYENIIVGICGGYEMMFRAILDENHLESSHEKLSGFAWIDDFICFDTQKVLKKDKYNIESMLVNGYEIHFGKSEKYPLYYYQEKKFGTFLHGVFENDNLRKWLFQKIDPSYKGYNFLEKSENIISSYVEEMGKFLDIDEIISCISK